MIETVCNNIESGDIAADLRLASTPKSLIRWISQTPDIGALRIHLLKNREDIYVILERAKRLLDMEVPAGYAHPGDVSLAAYLVLMSRSGESKIQQFIDRVARISDPSLRMAPKVARIIAASVPSNHEVGREQARVSSQILRREKVLAL